MKILEEIFNLNTVISEIKKETRRAYNFESKPDELETNIHIFSSVIIPLEVQQRYAKFNEDVKRLANEMLAELTEKRDSLTLRLLQQQNIQLEENLTEESEQNE